MTHAADLPDRELAPFRRALRAWYRRRARRLPWRATRDPYRVWISEIMLQQTTVAAVVPYYTRFLARFPTVRRLAQADEQEVLRLWEGLGYYSRAGNLHRAARTVVREHRGRIPRDVATLRTLSGVGRYTAGAIASFAFDLPAPIVEANTLRLYCRLLAYAGDPRGAGGQKRLWEFAGRLVPRVRPGELNQALMELGATVCTPESPACGACPVRRWCAACRAGRQGEIPRPARRPATTDVTEAAVAIEREGRYLLRRYLPGERWAGLWDFVRFPLPTGPAPPRAARVAGRPPENGDRRRPEADGASQAGKGKLPVPLFQPEETEGQGTEGQRAGGQLKNGDWRRREADGAAQTEKDEAPVPVFQHAAIGGDDLRAVRRSVRQFAGLEIGACARLTELRHTVTRYRITLRCYRAEWSGGVPGAHTATADEALSQVPSADNQQTAAAPAAPREFRWVDPARFEDYPLSVTARRLARLLERQSG